MYSIATSVADCLVNSYTLRDNAAGNNPNIMRKMYERYVNRLIQ